MELLPITIGMYCASGFFSDEDSALKSKFLSAANSLRDDFRFGITYTKEGHEFSE